MSRPRSEAREIAFQLWIKNNGQIKLIDLAEKLGVSDTQIRKWKSQDRWEDRLKGTLPEKGTLPKGNGNKGNVTKEKGTQKERPNTQRTIEPGEGEGPDLSDKHVLFVAEYLTDFNATRAAMAVGYSKRSAAVTGFRLLRNAKIQEEIRRQTEIVTNNLGITSQRVLLEYLKIAFADITSFVDFGQKDVPVMTMLGLAKDENGNILTKTVNYVDFKPSAEIDGTLISEVKQGKEGVTIKLHDKMKALEKLEKYLDLLPDHHRRMIEEKKLELARERLELDKQKTADDEGDEKEIHVHTGIPGVDDDGED